MAVRENLGARCFHLCILLQPFNNRKEELSLYLG